MTHWHEEKTVNIVEDMETLLILVMSRLTEFIIKIYAKTFSCDNNINEVF